MKSENARIGCGGVVGIIFLVLVVAGLGWFVYDVFRPRSPLEILVRRVISEPSVPDFHNKGEGRRSLDVTDAVCPQATREALGDLGARHYYRPKSMIAGDDAPERVDVYRVYESKNIFAMCRDHYVRILDVEIQRGTNQCRAFVSLLPTCDP
jgi:hypothetical protein